VKRSRGVAFVLAALAAGALGWSALAENITGAGASFPYPLYAKWASAYRAAGGGVLNYQSIGSGGGVAQIKAKTVTFGASDAPLTLDDLDKSGLAQFPTVVGGVVPVVNLPGVAAGQLVLDGRLLADLFLGKISRWNDPAIKALNPGVKLPDLPVLIVHRSDESGTSFVLTSYLSRVSGEWKNKVGAASALDWPTGMGAKGNEGVAANLLRTAGLIGYVEFAYARQNHLSQTRLINRDGKTVTPSLGSFTAAAANADWAAAARRGFYITLVDQPGAATWPITTTTYILVYRKPANPAATVKALKFFKWCYGHGREMAKSLDYAPLPDNAVRAIQTSWKGIKGSGS
jgi:phosphate transport system substrate-binding protein